MNHPSGLASLAILPSTVLSLVFHHLFFCLSALLWAAVSIVAKRSSRAIRTKSFPSAECGNGYSLSPIRAHSQPHVNWTWEPESVLTLINQKCLYAGIGDKPPDEMQLSFRTFQGTLWTVGNNFDYWPLSVLHLNCIFEVETLRDSWGACRVYGKENLSS